MERRGRTEGGRKEVKRSARRRSRRSEIARKVGLTGLKEGKAKGRK